MKWINIFLVVPAILFAKAFEINQKEYKKLDKIAEDSSIVSSDKGSSWHDYTKIYSLYFSPIKEEKLQILEIGIWKGGSIKLWEKYFSNANLHFIDISFEMLKYQPQRSSLYLADQSNVKELHDVMKQIGNPMDIIIDDGGHTMKQQITSFATLWPYLRSGGIYVIEDLHTSYWKDFYDGGGSIEKPFAGNGTTMQFLKDLLDDLNYIGARTMRATSNQDLTSIRDELSSYKTEILGMHFYDSLCFIIKK